MINVLLTSAATKIPLYEALREASRGVNPETRVIAGDVDPLTPVKYVADDFWLMPRLTEVSPGELTKSLLGHEVKLIMPTRDGELLFWANARAQLQQVGVEVCTSSPESLSRCIDKLQFSQWGTEAGLPVIPSSETPEEFKGSRLVAKERFGAGSQNLHLNVSLDEAVELSARLTNPLFQPFVEGDEISVDAYIDRNSKVHGLVLRRRDKVKNGESVITTTFRDADVEAQATTILEALELQGPVVMQAMMLNGGLQVIEVNARFGGASTTSISVGLDSLTWMVFEAFFPDQKLPDFMRANHDVRNIRMATDRTIVWP